jgi:hypothetical protein
MKNTLKNKLFEAIEKKIDEVYPDMTEVNRRKLGYLVQGIALDILFENIDGLSKNHSETVIEMESHKKMFKEHIESMQKDCKILMTNFKNNGMVKFEIDPKTRKPLIKARSTVIAETVTFLNKLNELTMKFYENVYKIDEDKDYNTQTTLF